MLHPRFTFALLAIAWLVASLPAIARADASSSSSNAGTTASIHYPDDPVSPEALPDEPRGPAPPYFRGAVDVGGSYFGLPDRDIAGGMFSVQGRLGAQLHPLFSLVYQGGLALAFLEYGGEQMESWAGGAIQSSVLATLTLAETVDIGVGPAADIYIWDSPWAEGAFSGATVWPGGHARLAAHVPIGLGRRPRPGIGADLRLQSAQGDFVVVAGGNAGFEWY